MRTIRERDAEQGPQGKVRFSPEKYNDVMWAGLYFVQMVVIIAWVMYCKGSGRFDVVQSARDSDKKVVMFNAFMNRKDATGHPMGLHLLASGTPSTSDIHEYAVVLMFTSVFLGFIWSSVWLLLLKFKPQQTTFISLMSCGVLMTLFGAYLLYVGSWLLGGIFVLFGPFVAIFLSKSKAAKFTAAMLEQVTGLVLARGAIFLVVVGVVLLQIAWILVWLLAMVGVVLSNKKMPSFMQLEMEDASSSTNVTMWIVLLMLCFFWACQVFSNVIHTTVAGFIGRWYFNEHMEEPIKHSFGHASTYLFGSICFGSLIVALIQTLRWIADQARDENADNPVAAVAHCIADCILSCVEEIAKLYNFWCFIVISIYSCDFYQGGQEVMRSIYDTDVITAINAINIVDLVTFMANLGCGLVNACFIGLTAWRLSLPVPWIIFTAVIAFMIAFVMNSICGRTLESGVGSVFYCYTQDQKALRDRNEEMNKMLMENLSITRF
jgi:hypothetical protein